MELSLLRIILNYFFYGHLSLFSTTLQLLKIFNFLYLSSNLYFILYLLLFFFLLYFPRKSFQHFQLFNWVFYLFHVLSLFKKFSRVLLYPIKRFCFLLLTFGVYFMNKILFYPWVVLELLGFGHCYFSPKSNYFYFNLFFLFCSLF